MQKEVYYLFALAAGLAVAIQTGVNAQLRLTIQNPTLTALISFLTGTFVLFMYVMLTSSHQLPTPATMYTISWWKYLGGVMGAFYITTVVIIAPRIGAANTLGFIVAGQLISAVIFDHFGLIGFVVRQITFLRILGVIFLILGVYLIRK
jgi:bacterial/archaeal transporter family-2 protein